MQQKQIGIAFLDTGISPVADFTQPKNRIVAFIDFLHGKKMPYDDNGHGTHVAGIACGNGFLSGGRYCGSAPEANIIALKILDASGQGTSKRAIAACQWILEHAQEYHIQVVNLSIGTNDKTIYTPLLDAIHSLWQRGIVVLSAAGNPEGDYVPPLLSKKIISVGTWEDRSHFFRKNDLQTMPDVWAHGEHIVSVCSPDYQFGLPGRAGVKVVDHTYIAMSGASMATPFVSGMVAQLLIKNPTLSPQQVKQYLCRKASQKNGLLE